MKTEGSLLCLRENTRGRCPERGECSPHPISFNHFTVWLVCDAVTVRPDIFTILKKIMGRPISHLLMVPHDK
jgi:hypothetical protein